MEMRLQLLSTGEPRLRAMAFEPHFGHSLLFFIMAPLEAAYSKENKKFQDIRNWSATFEYDGPSRCHVPCTTYHVEEEKPEEREQL